MAQFLVQLLRDLIPALRNKRDLPSLVLAVITFIAAISGGSILALLLLSGTSWPVLLLPVFLVCGLFVLGIWLLRRHLSASWNGNAPTQAWVAPPSMPFGEPRNPRDTRTRLLVSLTFAATMPAACLTALLGVQGADWLALSLSVGLMVALLWGGLGLIRRPASMAPNPKPSSKTVDRFRWGLLATAIIANNFFLVSFLVVAYFPGWSQLSNVYNPTCLIGPVLMLVSVLFIIIPNARLRRAALAASAVNLLTFVIILGAGENFGLKLRAADYAQVVSLAETGRLQPDASGKAALPARYSGLSNDGLVLISGDAPRLEVEFVHDGLFGSEHLIHVSDGHQPQRENVGECLPMRDNFANWFFCAPG